MSPVARAREGKRLQSFKTSFLRMVLSPLSIRFVVPRGAVFVSRWPDVGRLFDDFRFP